MPKHHPHHSHHRLHAPRGPREGEFGSPGRHHGGPRHEAGGEHHARRRERMFEAGGLKLIALHLIAQQPSHGYDLIRAIGQLVGGDYQPSPGTIYPTLSVLVDMGHASATEVEGGRKQYAITAEGQQALQDQAEAVQRLLTKLSHGKERGLRERPVALVRALENFKTALRLKVKGQPDAPAPALTESQVAAIAAILDQAALDIEKA